MARGGTSAVLDALEAVAAGTAGLEESRLPEASSLYVTAFRGLDHLMPEALAAVDPWISGRLDELRLRAARAVNVVDGPCLGQADLRADNILVQPDGRVRIVDWPYACRSQPWVDGVLLAVNVEVLGGLHDERGDVVDAVPLITEWAVSHGASHDDVLDVLVGMLAYYTWAAAQPPVPGLPTLRREQGVAARAALRVVRRSWSETLA